MVRRISGVVLVLALVLAPGLTTAAGAVDETPPVNQTLPSISGITRVGELLTASPGTWDPAATSYAYRWLRDGNAIAGADAKSYRLVGTDRTHQIAVRVVALGAGGTSEPATSAAGKKVGLGRFDSTAKPVLSGTRRWGRTLTATAGGWSPTATTLKYRWFRDGVQIGGAKGSKRKLTVADYGTHITVRVSAHRADYAVATAKSVPTVAIGHRVGVKKRFTYSVTTRGRITASTATFRKLVADSYADPRGWRSAGYSFRRVAQGGDFTVVLSSASKVPSFGYPCDSTWSCRVGRYVIINQNRWLHASPAWNKAKQPLRDYRHMVVNHETGHWLGHRHKSCGGKGKLAPIMMQQSKGLKGCAFNPFPLPSERWTNR